MKRRTKSNRDIDLNFIHCRSSTAHVWPNGAERLSSLDITATMGEIDLYKSFDFGSLPQTAT